MLHPLTASPPRAKAEAMRLAPPATKSQALVAHRRGKASRLAPICNGTRAKPRPSHAGSRNRKNENVPCRVSSCR
jgi:hypothetical protein